MQSIDFYRKKIGAELQELLNMTPREANLEAQFILQFVLKETSSQLIIQRSKTISKNDVHSMDLIVKQRLVNIPLAYIFNEWDFYGKTYYITPETLIPRQDTELMIDILLQSNNKESQLNILDLGTGSGVIGLTLAQHFSCAQVTLSDISSSAIKVAEINGKNTNVKNVQFIHSDWFESIKHNNFDIIVSNPPYIAETDSHLLHPELLAQPRIALVSEMSGLKDIKHIVQNAKQYLNESGMLIIEHGYDQAMMVQDIFIANDFNNIAQHKDINGVIRITSGIKI
ncbi:peptide chain release factor N(5)-glutamine methyltransferase [Methylophilaceae bacterium]|nr:peptide chain release factor N(5)-glutamine methyltransferase [Methylophilaceae bacterium]